MHVTIGRSHGCWLMHAILLLLSQELAPPATFPREGNLNRLAFRKKNPKSRAAQAKASLPAPVALGHPASTAELKDEPSEHPFPTQAREQSAAARQTRSRAASSLQCIQGAPAPPATCLSPEECRALPPLSTPPVAQDLRQGGQE